MHWGFFASNVSVLIEPNAFIEGRIDLIQIIKNISPADIRAKQTLLSQHAHRLHYSLDDYPNDAFEIMMKGVYHQALVRRHQQSANATDEIVVQPDDTTTDTILMPTLNTENVIKPTHVHDSTTTSTTAAIGADGGDNSVATAVD